AKPVISLSTPAGTAIDENNGAGVVRVILSKTYHSDVTVLLSCSGSASAGTDYSANATTVVIPAGETSVDVSITSIDDSVSEGDENVIVAIDSVVNGTEDGTQQTEFSITDDDVAKASLSLAGGGSIAEDGSSETVTVSLSSTSVSDITVNLAYSGNAANTADYTRSADTVTIPAGSTSTTFQVASAADALDETDETVTVDIDSVAGGMEDGVQQQTITITDDDDPPQVQMDLFVSGGLESGGSLTLPVSLSAESGLTVSVDYTVTGTATAGTDYTPASGTLTIPAGSTSGTINITIIDDTIPEADESLTVTLSNPVNSSLGGNTSYAHGIINDDDPPQVQVGAPMGMGDESFSSLTLQVNLSAVSTLDVSVDYTVTGTATSGSDYTSASSTLTIPAGSTSGTISITIINDTLFEGNESLNIALTNPVNAGLGSSTSYSYTILDNDNPPQVQLGSTTGSGDETSSSLTLQVNLSAVSGLAASVDYAVTGTATSGSDYTPASGTVTIPAGSTSGTISITIIDDALEEDDESLNITISNPVNASLGLYTNYNYTIVENDRKGPAITAAGYYDTDSNGFLDH
ncbi:MAG: hypothetical protein GY753_17075, partial [Gammaproteobacteria bacterium]|nr:hypothetical protein [Gammaproteobacteria bacterium]